MNIEQVEGQLAEYDGKLVAVVISIRGCIRQIFYGDLIITPDWINNIILYGVRFYSDSEITFQASDVFQIIPNPTEKLDATIILKSDAWMEQLKMEHA